MLRCSSGRERERAVNTQGACDSFALSTSFWLQLQNAKLDTLSRHVARCPLSVACGKLGNAHLLIKYLQIVVMCGNPCGMPQARPKF